VTAGGSEGILESARLCLREISGMDAPFILEILTDPDFIANVGDRGVHDLAAAQSYIADRMRPSYQTHGFGLYLVELRTSAEPLGICGLLRRDSHPDIEIGFAFLPRARGQGYALEAALATMNFARCRLGLKRVVALTALHNHRSIRVLERLGFLSERIVRLAPNDPDRLLLAWSDVPHENLAS
jgi:RimJ/RimL family protein N-acetyltransferase